MRNLAATLIQCELAWESPEDNRQQFAELFRQIPDKTDLIVLPEMFTTGFSMNALANAEPPGGMTEAWMTEVARQYDCAVTGSIAVQVGQQVFNRMLFVTPEQTFHYDKRHLFRMAGEHKRYAMGDERVIVNWRDWRINLQVCYDLRFPVFSRNRDNYDLLIYVANWPSARATHWRSLLIARAIENQAAVIGVNRIGNDAKGLNYQGDSIAIDASGNIVGDMLDSSGVQQVVFDGQALLNYRESFPCHMDADSFELL
ncbi:MAG: amidohydrolase [Halioglobus sp.]